MVGEISRTLGKEADELLSLCGAGGGLGRVMYPLRNTEAVLKETRAGEVKGSIH